MVEFLADRANRADAHAMCELALPTQAQRALEEKIWGSVAHMWDVFAMCESGLCEHFPRDL